MRSCAKARMTSLVDDTRDDQMPGTAHLARTPRNAPSAVLKVVVDSSCHDGHARTLRVREQICQRLLDQRFIALAAEGTELDFAPPQDFCQLMLGGPGEQDIAQTQAAFSWSRLTARAPVLRMNARNASRPDRSV